MANADNPRTGAEFEQLVQAFFASQGLSLVPKLGVPVGIGAAKKVHRFDLGSESPPVLVECKCHVWTEGGNAPSAKLTVWNEAMLSLRAHRRSTGRSWSFSGVSAVARASRSIT